MEAREWALILFTILAQMAVGSFLVLGALHFYALRKAGMEAADRLSDRALYAIGPVMILGMIASLLHLGSPLVAYRAVSNFQTSWLSREILSGVLFAGLGALFALMQWRKIASFAVRNVVALLAAAAGVVLVYCMSRVYMLPAEPVWNIATTPVSFFTTTLLLGALAIGAALVANVAYLKAKSGGCDEQTCELMRASVRYISITSLALLGLQFIVIPVTQVLLNTGGSLGAAGSAMMLGEYGPAYILRLALLFLGAGLFTLFLYRASFSPDRDALLTNLVYAAFAMVLVSEVIGRFIFYATRVSVAI